jgi:alpha-D-xyloside xylohydrolase
MDLTSQQHSSSTSSIPAGLALQECGLSLPLPDGRVLRMDFYGESAVRVRCLPAGGTGRNSAIDELVLRQDPCSDHGWTSEQGDALTLRRGSWSLVITADGSVECRYGDQGLLKDDAAKRLFPTSPYEAPADATGVEACFAIGDDALYGLGQFPDGVLNWRGQQATLIHGNISVAVPMIVSNKGWGLLWNNASHTDFRDDASGMNWRSEVADGLDYVLFMGGDFSGVIATYRTLTGGSPSSHDTSMASSSPRNAIDVPRK